MRSRSLLLSLASTLALGGVLDAAETVDKYPDGTIQARYETDAEGVKTGGYASFYPDGKPKEKGAYRKGLKQGRWMEYDDDAKGRMHRQENYDKGLLSGPFVENKDGKPRLKATYAKGELATPISVYAPSGALERAIVYPHGLEALTAQLAKLLEPASGELFADKPSTTAPFKAGTLAKPFLEQDLHALQVLRMLCGAPWQGLTVDAQASDLVQHAALLAAVKGFSHEPVQPDGMAPDFFAAAAEGTKSCVYWSNAGNDGLVRSLWNWANDPDANVGHRRWLLNPALGRVGFGQVPPHTLVDILDTSGGQEPWDVVAFPGRGYFPRALVGKDAQWSLHLNMARVPHLAIDSVAIAIHRMGDDYALGDEVQLSTPHVDTSNQHPLSPTVVFTPKLDPGPQRLWVEVASRGSEAPVLSYIVDLVDIALPAPSALLPKR